jgi:PEP-CTERM motif
MKCFPKLVAFAATTVSAIALSASANAAVFGTFGSNAAAAGNAAIAQGNTSSVLANLSAASLNGLDVLWVLNGNNGASPAQVLANATAISSFVNAGGVLLYHDRYVAGNGSTAAAALPGGSAINFVRATLSTINVQTAVNPVISGPGGTITDTTLDGGNSSTHGFATLASLPTGATAILNNGTSGNVVDFFYKQGAGSVYYSSIPLDFYLSGGGSNGASFRNIYTPNVIAQAATLAAPVPEPATWALMLGGFGIMGGALRRRRQSVKVTYA